MLRSIDDINAKIKSGSVVVMNAEEIIEVVKRKGVRQAAREVDVVTTGTFAPMCSSGAMLNVKQPKEKMKFSGRATLNGVPAYAGNAAADLYLGATALPDNDPRNDNGRKGRFRYGGAHVIEDLISGKKVTLLAETYGTDCYPNKRVEREIGLDDLNDAILLNPRNCYQNYNVAVNLSNQTIYTYLGKLKPNLGNAYYCSAGQLSPLFNDPLFRTIGIGTRVLLCGTQGYVAWNGTQHNPTPPRLKNGTPRVAAGNLMLIGNLKEMKAGWLRAVSVKGYGVSISISVGVPIPILDEEIMHTVSLGDADLKAPVVDYSIYYPYGDGDSTLGEVSYADLKSGSIVIKGKEIPTGAFSSYAQALQIADHLKAQIRAGDFYLTQAQAPLAGMTLATEAS